MSRRPRRTAGEIANLQPRGRWVVIVVIAIGLSIILFFKFSISDESSKTFELLVGNPDLELPRSATDPVTQSPKREAQPDQLRQLQREGKQPHRDGVTERKDAGAANP